MNRIGIPLLSLTVLAIPLSVAAEAATFRVTSKIYEGASEQPAAEHWILFDDQVVYDLPQVETRFVTIYDLTNDEVILLDRQQHLQTRLKTQDLLRMTAQARAAAKTQQQQELLGLNAKVETDAQGGLSIRFANSEHHTTTQTPPDPSLAALYGRFADLALRLNLFRRGLPPPFARMTLNDHIAGQGKMPLETTLTLQLEQGQQQYRSKLAVTRLSKPDRTQIDQVRGMLALYREVGLKEFPGFVTKGS